MTDNCKNVHSTPVALFLTALRVVKGRILNLPASLVAWTFLNMV